MSLVRSPHGLLLDEWASGSGAILHPPEADGVSRETGLTADYEVDNLITLGLFNQWLRELTTALLDVQKNGVQAWVGDVDTTSIAEFDSGQSRNYHAGELTRGSDGAVYVCKVGTGSLTTDPTMDATDTYWELLSNRLDPYIEGAIVLGSDGVLYRCKQSTGSNTQDPATDASGMIWEPLIPTIPSGSQSRAGIVQLATISEAVAGESKKVAVTVQGVSAAIRNRLSQLASDGVVDSIELRGTTLHLSRTKNLSVISVDLSPIMNAFAPKQDAVLTGTVNVPEPLAPENSIVLATTAFARRVGAARRTTVRATQTQAGITRAANATELSAATAQGVFVDLAGLEARLSSIIGPQGSEGPAGRSVPGPAGDAGDQGDPGPQGSPGESIQGPRGDRGDPGASVRGAKGPKGEPGRAIPGERGDRGDPGASVQGPQGHPGISGTSIQGDSGDPGPQGDPGPKGEIGPKGETGPRGNPGRNGVSYKTQYDLSTFHLDASGSGLSTAWIDTNFVLQSGDLLLGYFALVEISNPYNRSGIFLLAESDLSTSRSGTAANRVFKKSDNINLFGEYGTPANAQFRGNDVTIISLAKDSSDSSLWYQRMSWGSQPYSMSSYHVRIWVLRPTVVTV